MAGTPGEPGGLAGRRASANEKRIPQESDAQQHVTACGHTHAALLGFLRPVAAAVGANVAKVDDLVFVLKNGTNPVINRILHVARG
ncbi:hypothetical protein [Aquamicrobium terrae]